MAVQWVAPCPPALVNFPGYVIADADFVIEAANGGRDVVLASVTFMLPNHVEDLILTGASALDGMGNGLANDLSGNGRANRLDGLSGADTINGSNGDDTIIGGSGADRLTGGAGADIFRYEAPLQVSTDRTLGDLVTDYRVTDDQIEVSAAGFGGGLSAGMNLATTNRFKANFTGLAESGVGQFVFEIDARTLWWDVDGTGAEARFALATFTGLYNLAASEIVVVG
jgi:Ca2+-binding RTX toxin-like protein